MGRFVGQGVGRYSETAEVTEVSANRTLAPNSLYFVNTTSGAVTLTLPSGPAPGNFVIIVDAWNQFASNNCIINPSGDGSTVGGFNDNLTLNLSQVNIFLRYSLGRNDWVVTNLL